MGLKMISQKSLFGQTGEIQSENYTDCQVKREWKEKTVGWHQSRVSFENIIRKGILWDKKLLPDKISSSDSCIKFNLFVFGMHLIVDSNRVKNTYFSTKKCMILQRERRQYPVIDTLPANILPGIFI